MCIRVTRKQWVKVPCMCQGDHPRSENRQLWQQLVRAALPGVSWSTDCDLKLVSCSGPWLAVGRLREPDLVGTKLADLLEITSADDPVLRAHREALAGAERTVSFILKGGDYCGVVVPLRSNDAVVGTVLNALEQSIVDTRCQAIADTSLDVILFLRPDGTIEYVNRMAQRVGRDQVVGKSVYNFVPADQRDAVRKAVALVLETGTPTTIDLQFSHQLGRVVWQSVRIGPWRHGNSLVGVVALAADVTQRKLVVQKLLDEERLLKQMLDLQERERRLVAYEIHDGFIQDVIAVRMMLEATRGQLLESQSGILARLEDSVDLLAKAIGEGRRLISELRPMIIDEMGLVEAVQFLVEEERARGGAEIRFVPRVSFDRLPPLLQATVFRIVREAVTNARRHGHAEIIEIRLTDVANHVVIEVQDDGRGFDPSQVPQNRYGLEGIRERAKLFGGGATIESKLGKGTRITVKLPTDVPESTCLPPDDSWRWSI